MRRLKLARLEQKYGRPAVMFTCAVAVLIWLKLRLVTGVPRSVYAQTALCDGDRIEIVHFIGGG